MELVKGVSLQELVALKGPLPASQAADIARQTAAGLEHAHQAGLIHRDVKPENLLVRTDGSVKVVDFGLAMIDENDEEFSMAMILGQDRLGTADYVAPEQALNSYRVDCRADIYSLGCTMYYALTGRPPFPVRSVPEKLRGHRCRKPRPISDTRDDVPEELLAIIDRMLAKQPADRFQSAAEVEAALAPFGQREPVEFDFAAVLERRVRIARRREAERRRREKEDTTLKGQSNTVIMPQQKERQEQADSVIQDQIQALQARSGDDGAADT